MYNDGKCDNLENWPMTVEYFAYKKWSDNIQSKAMETLRFTVNRLLLDFEDHSSDLGNKVEDFSKGPKESKHDALIRLQTMLTDEKAVPIKTKSSKRGSGKKSLKSEFNKLI